MLLKKHDLQYKQFLKMERRLSVVRDLLSQVPWVELKEPYQSGWFIRYEFRPETARRKDIDVLREVLRIGFYAHSFTNSADDVRRIRGGQTHKITKKGKGRVDFRPGRRYITENEYNTLIPAVKKYFHLDEHSQMYKLYKRKYYYPTLSLNWLILKVKPRIITHIQKRGGALQKEEEFLYDKLRTYWREYFGYRKHFPTGEERTETRAKIQKFIKGEMNDISLNTYKIDYD